MVWYLLSFAREWRKKKCNLQYALISLAFYSLLFIYIHVCDYISAFLILLIFLLKGESTMGIEL